MSRLVTLACVLLLAGCGSSPAPDATVSDTQPLATRWPILLSHSWSNNAEDSFVGDEPAGFGRFDRWGVKRALEAGGAIVYQPDKIAYSSHENRGQLLYKKCAGTTLAQRLCESGSGEVVDGVHLATQHYCADPALRARSGFDDEDGCRRGLQFNVICHSQGCADSRYMLAAVRNEYSGELMYKHVASWTSLAGANKGTAQADWVLEMLAACLTPQCRSLLMDLAFAVDTFEKNQTLVVDGSISVVALSRKYMLDTTDMSCDPAKESCPPSFNQRYPLPEDPTHPILYQSFSSQIDDITHPCYRGNRLFWNIVMEREGPNDGNISVDSQAFTTYGRDGSGGRTPVIARTITGTSLDPARPHPGLNHMAWSDSEVPGIPGVSCGGEDNSMFRFSRVGLFRDIVAELGQWGY